MRTYEFDMVLRDLSEVSDDQADALFAAGCEKSIGLIVTHLGEVPQDHIEFVSSHRYTPLSNPCRLVRQVKQSGQLPTSPPRLRPLPPCAAGEAVWRATDPA